MTAALALATDPDLAPALATIREHPDDDGPRLVLADWLEERGECERAELIRVQCQLGDETHHYCKADYCVMTQKPCASVALRAREHALLAAHGNQWRAEVAMKMHPGELPEIADPPDSPEAAVKLLSRYPTMLFFANAEFRRGFIERLTLPLAALLPRACRACHATGVGDFVADGDHVVSETACQHCDGGEQPPLISRQTLAASLPALRGVRLTDREPVLVGVEGAQSAGWFNACSGALERPEDLPSELWAPITGHNDEPSGTHKWFTRPTEAAATSAAQAALLTAAAKWLRQA